MELAVDIRSKFSGVLVVHQVVRAPSGEEAVYTAAVSNLSKTQNVHCDMLKAVNDVSTLGIPFLTLGSQVASTDDSPGSELWFLVNELVHHLWVHHNLLHHW